MNSFDETVELMLIDLKQVEGTLILFAVCDDTILRDYTIETLRKRLSPEITLPDFRYDPQHISLLEGAVEAVATSNGRPVVSVTGFEALPRDKRTEAIRLLNWERGRFGLAGIAVILWVNRATLAEIATQSADFYSWRSGTFIIEPPPGWDTLKSARRGYLQALVAQNEFVNLQGLAPERGGHIVQMRMEDMFIPLRVEQEVRPSPERLRMVSQVTVFGPEGPVVIDILRDEKGVPTAKEKTGRYKVELEVVGGLGASLTVYGDRWSQSVSLNVPREFNDFRTASESKPRRVEIPEVMHERRAVVLGDPGAGKTILLRYLAYMVAQAQIDGCRREVARCIEEFVQTHPHCRVVVTSRIVGYREARLGERFSQFTISPFEDGEIRRFAENWYRALGRPKDGAGPLVQAIQASPSVRRLAANPLLLTVIALLHWRGTKLPHHRVTLYRMASETLVDQWMSHRRVNPEGWDVHETLQILLPAIAWHLHSTTSSGLIGEHELHRLLVETLQQHEPRLSKQEAHSRASQFRRNVSEFSGIFLERGLDQDGRGLYGFLHLTFEEYFAALRLADQWEREADKGRRDGDQVLTPLLHNPRWTAARALGQLGAAAATPEVIGVLLKCLTDSEGYVRGTAVGALSNLSAYVAPQERPAAIKLFLPLTLSGDARNRETGYVGLRNLLAESYSEAVQA
ncbi:MAG: hypothetical protein HY268_07390 [Deltaproteobacteria bacterium]|nr:hypothetical protein [Deltaproteobacteria bacterium]